MSLFQESMFWFMFAAMLIGVAVGGAIVYLIARGVVDERNEKIDALAEAIMIADKEVPYSSVKIMRADQIVKQRKKE